MKQMINNTLVIVALLLISLESVAGGKYTVTYDTNTPTGCSLSNIPSEKHSPFETVLIRGDNLTCSGYIFRGYQKSGSKIKNFLHLE